MVYMTENLQDSVDYDLNSSVYHKYYTAMHGGNKQSRKANTYIIMLLDVGLGLGGFYVAKNLGLSNVQSYLVAAIGPTLSIIITLIRSRVISVFSMLILLMQLGGIAFTFIVGKHDKWLLYKDGILSIICALAMYLTLVMFKPMFFYIFQRYNSDGTRAGYQAWDELWQYPHIKKALGKITFMWGSIILIEGIIKLIISVKLDFSVGFGINNIAPLLIAVIGAMYTMKFLREAGEESKEIDKSHGIIVNEQLYENELAS